MKSIDGEGGEPTDGDGGDGELLEVLSYDIQVGLNGFFLTISYSDISIPDERYIVHNMDEVIELLRESF